MSSTPSLSQPTSLDSNFDDTFDFSNAIADGHLFESDYSQTPLNHSMQSENSFALDSDSLNESMTEQEGLDISRHSDISTPRTTVKLHFHILPHHILKTNSTMMRSKNRIAKISGRVYARCVFLESRDVVQRGTNAPTPSVSSALDFRWPKGMTPETETGPPTYTAPEYSIYIFGGMKKRLMSRFRRLRVAYDNNAEEEAQQSAAQSSATPTSTSFQEGDDDDETPLDDDTNITQNDTPPSQPNSPHLQINFDVANEKEYAKLRLVAGHVMWCSRINKANTLLIHGGSQDPDVDHLENRYSNHIFTYNLETHELDEPQFNGTWEIPSGREGHSVHSNPSLTRAWIFGGSDGKRYYNDIYIFDAETLTFTHCHPRPLHASHTHYIPSPRFYHSSIFYNDCIYVFGGLGKSGLCSTRFMYVFDTRVERWLPPLAVPQDVLPHGVGEHAMCLFKQHYAILHGGRYDGQSQNNIYIIDLRTNEWILAKDEPPDSLRDRSGHSIIEVNDQLWVIGGNASLTNHNDISIIDCEILEPHEHGLEPVPRYIVSPSFEDLCCRIIQREPTHFRHEDSLAGKMYVISPCDHENYFLRFASVSGPLQFSRILSKYSRLVLTHNGAGELILKNQRSTEKKSTYLTLSSSGAKCGRKASQATPLKLLPEDQVDEHGNIKKDYHIDPKEIKKFTKYHIRTLDCDTYLTYQSTGARATANNSKKSTVIPRVTFGPERRTLFYALPLKHRKIFVKSLGVNMYLKDGRNNIRFSKIPNFYTRLIWLLLELPSGLKQNYLRTFSGKFFCLEQGVLTLTHRSSAICIDHVQTRGRNSQVVTLSLPSIGYLGVQIDPHTKQPSMVILPGVPGESDTGDNIENAYFEIREIT